MDTKQTAAAVVQAVVGYVKRATTAQDTRLTALEARVAAIEARPAALKYQGVWRESQAGYPEGTTITHAGSLWITRRATTSRPGTDDSWQLAVKRGRDGRDGRDPE